MKKKIGVLLSGCGYLDGAEVHEATLTLYFLDKAGAKVIAMAPDRPQIDVIDHNRSEPVLERRNVRAESARIARGNVRDVASVQGSELDALVIPGGYGAAKNLCTFATHSESCTVLPDVGRLITELHAKRKPIGAMCIAPVVLAKVLGADYRIEVTIGSDEGTAKAIASMGARHVAKSVDQLAVDELNRIVTTPCYMLAAGPAEVGVGIERLVTKLMSWL